MLCLTIVKFFLLNFHSGYHYHKKLDGRLHELARYVQVQHMWHLHVDAQHKRLGVVLDRRNIRLVFVEDRVKDLGGLVYVIRRLSLLSQHAEK